LGWGLGEDVGAFLVAGLTVLAVGITVNTGAREIPRRTSQQLRALTMYG
jgi:hypothetical protein